MVERPVPYAVPAPEGETWQTQRVGIGHPDTLASQLEYGIVLAFSGDRRRSTD